MLLRLATSAAPAPATASISEPFNSVYHSVTLQTVARSVMSAESASALYHTRHIPIPAPADSKSKTATASAATASPPLTSPHHVRTARVVTARRSQLDSSDASSGASVIAEYERTIRHTPLCALADCDGAKCVWNRSHFPTRRDLAAAHIIERTVHAHEQSVKAAAPKLSSPDAKSAAVAAAGSTPPRLVVASVGSGLCYTELVVALSLSGIGYGVDLHLIDSSYKELFLRYTAAAKPTPADSKTSAGAKQPSKQTTTGSGSALPTCELQASTRLPFDLFFAVRTNYFWSCGGRKITLPLSSPPAQPPSAAAAPPAPQQPTTYQSVSFDSLPDDERERVNTSLLLAQNDALFTLVALCDAASTSACGGAPIRVFAHVNTRSFVSFAVANSVRLNTLFSVDVKMGDGVFADQKLLDLVVPKFGIALLFTSPDHALHVVPTSGAGSSTESTTAPGSGGETSTAKSADAGESNQSIDLYSSHVVFP